VVQSAREDLRPPGPLPRRALCVSAEERFGQAGTDSQTLEKTRIEGTFWVKHPKRAKWKEWA
jgi:hypothetical protein